MASDVVILIPDNGRSWAINTPKRKGELHPYSSSKDYEVDADGYQTGVVRVFQTAPDPDDPDKLIPDYSDVFHPEEALQYAGTGRGKPQRFMYHGRVMNEEKLACARASLQISKGQRSL